MRGVLIKREAAWVRPPAREGSRARVAAPPDHLQDQRSDALAATCNGPASRSRAPTDPRAQAAPPPARVRPRARAAGLRSLTCGHLASGHVVLYSALACGRNATLYSGEGQSRSVARRGGW